MQSVNMQSFNEQSLLTEDESVGAMTCGQKINSCLKISFDEDSVSTILGIFLFLITIAISTGMSITSINNNIMVLYMTGFSFVTIYLTNKILNFENNITSILSLLFFSLLARLIADIPIFKQNHIGAAVWAILLGAVFNLYCQCFGTKKDALDSKLKAEYFIKISIVLLTVDLSDIVSKGTKGMLVSIVDTLLLFAFGLLIIKIFKLEYKPTITTIGATIICGSSAASSISSTIGTGSDVTNLIIGSIGIFNIPLIPLMPLANSTINAEMLGAWIGGTIDSTGPVIASASIVGGDVLKVASIIKMLQNILIGPICLILALLETKGCSLKVIIEKFPKFVLGFIITAVIFTLLPSDLKANVFTNSFALSEWFSLLGFFLIGYELKYKELMQSKSLYIICVYLLTQTVDIASTFGFSYLAFGN